MSDDVAPITDEFELFTRIGGTTTPAEDDGGIHNARYLSASFRLTANLVVPLPSSSASELDLFVRIGGTVTPAEGHGGLHNVRYMSASRRLYATLVVPLSVIESVGLAVALTDLFAVLADRAVARVAPGDAAASDALRSALVAAGKSLA